MKNKLTLNAERIREEQIPKETFGYSSSFINKFLDNIADDYDLMEEIVAELEQKIDNREVKIEELEKMINNISHEKNIIEEELTNLKRGGATDFPTVIKRITQTENRVSQIEMDLSKKLENIANLIKENQK